VSTLGPGPANRSPSSVGAVRVRVGPLSSAGVSLWIAYARTVISRSLVRPDELGVPLSGDVVELFEGYLDTWEREASDHTTFLWEAEVPTDQVTALGASWFLIASRLAEVAERRGYPISPPEGDEFYRALINAFLAGLDAEGGELAVMADELRAEWPGLKSEES